MKPENLITEELLIHYEDAIRDSHYNPTSQKYNKSGFTKSELFDEIWKRMNPTKNTN